MSAPALNAAAVAAPNALALRLQALSSAEDFVAFFAVECDERVLRVNRLHILKRFFQYLQREPGLEALDEVGQFRRYRELLQRACADFTASDARTEKVFKVFQDADGSRRVPLSRLRDALPSRQAA